MSSRKKEQVFHLKIEGPCSKERVRTITSFISANEKKLKHISFIDFFAEETDFNTLLIWFDGIDLLSLKFNFRDTIDPFFVHQYCSAIKNRLKWKELKTKSLSLGPNLDLESVKHICDGLVETKGNVEGIRFQEFENTVDKLELIVDMMEKTKEIKSIDFDAPKRVRELRAKIIREMMRRDPVFDSPLLSAPRPKRTCSQMSTSKPTVFVHDGLIYAKGKVPKPIDDPSDSDDDTFETSFPSSSEEDEISSDPETPLSSDNEEEDSYYFDPNDIYDNTIIMNL